MIVGRFQTLLFLVNFDSNTCRLAGQNGILKVWMRSLSLQYELTGIFDVLPLYELVETRCLIRKSSLLKSVTEATHQNHNCGQPLLPIYHTQLP